MQCVKILPPSQELVNSEADSEKSKLYSLWLGDIVLIGTGVSADQANVVLTLAAKRRIKSISLYVEEDDDDEVKEDQSTAVNGKSDKKFSSSARKNNASPGKNQLSQNGQKEKELLGRGHRRAIIEQKTRVGFFLSKNVTPTYFWFE